MNTAKLIKYAAQLSVASIGGICAALWGGWDAMLKALLICMAVDYLSGIAVAALGKSTKSLTGRITSNAAFTGLLRKGFELLVVLVAAQLGGFTGGDYIRDMVVLFFVGSEGISIVENGGLLGVPLPGAVKKWFEALREKGEQDDGT